MVNTKYIWKFVSIVLLFLFFGMGRVDAYDINWEQKIYPDLGEGSSLFGNDVEIQGNIAVVSAYLEDSIAEDSGSVYVYIWEAGFWHQVQELVQTSNESSPLSAQFGTSIALDGDYLVVGAPTDGNHKGFTLGAQGAVYVYKWSYTDNKFVDYKTITDPNLVEGSLFGFSVDIDGDRIVVGAPQISLNSGCYFESGKTYVFKLTPDWHTEAVFEPAHNTCDTYAYEVKISGDFIIVNAMEDDFHGEDSGAVYVYHYDERLDRWTEFQKIKYLDPQTYGYFGQSIDIYKEFIVISSGHIVPYGGNSRPVFIYKLMGDNTFQLVQEISIATNNFYFGHDLSLVGNYLIISNPFDSEVSNAGKIHTYYYDSNSSTFVANMVLEPRVGQTNDAFGYSVMTDGEKIIVGSPFDDDNGHSSGSAYIYEIN
ncbi:MAG: hypothetical protein ACD_18C00325G0005 [uncultured bacterium]|nr:MAG: hypothetical protein ACD_18C00325G0005 [uncultured bacterium]OGH91384.1 MAG: hypothetical protein A2507_04680 [Candidatus Magasanikbacteria bacterium RIFOXYD12_FULL_33_17]HAO52471.1 hypothetical protein [Candidatus Magasanikbacteria bacterium]